MRGHFERWLFALENDRWTARRWALATWIISIAVALALVWCCGGRGR